MTESTSIEHELSKYLDNHLVLPIQEFFKNKEIYPLPELLRSEFELLKRTNMVDSMIDVYCELNETRVVPAEIRQRREEVLSELNQLCESAKPILSFLSMPKLIQGTTLDRTDDLQSLRDEFNIGPEQLDILYHLAKFKFECGDYRFASKHLENYRIHATQEANLEKSFAALWGKFCADIIMHRWNTARKDIIKLKESIDNNGFSKPLNLMTQRLWLMHWSLFVFFNCDEGRASLIDLFFQDPYLNAIQTLGQHLLRYLTCAVILEKGNRKAVKELIRVLKTDEDEQKDPLLNFVTCLCVHYDFERAKDMLIKCEKVIANDFFICVLKDDFVNCARVLIFETACRLYSRVSLSMLGNSLNLQQEAAERWIATLISNLPLESKVDFQSNCITIGTQPILFVDQIMEKVQTLTSRTYLIGRKMVGMKNKGTLKPISHMK